MIKGTQRQMVMVRTSESESFEMAYFVLRPDARTGKSEKSMIDEANSIVSSVCDGGVTTKREKRGRVLRRALLFLAGAMFGALVLGGVMILLFAV